MLGFMLSTVAQERGREWTVRSAGTHAIEGSTMSSRTRDALISVTELGEHRYGAHRSHEVTAPDVTWADVVLGAEASNVRFTRGLVPSEETKVVQVRQFVLHAPPGASLSEQLSVVSALELDPRLDVPDPAGADQDVYDEVAHSLWLLAQEFASRVHE
jgi:protein-tyrosine-phosphatase